MSPAWCVGRKLTRFAVQHRVSVRVGRQPAVVALEGGHRGAVTGAAEIRVGVIELGEVEVGGEGHSAIVRLSGRGTYTGSMASPVSTLRHFPIARLLAVAEMALLVRQHVLRLEADERRRLIQLVRRGRGRPKNLSDRERRELAELVQKMEPRQFVSTATRRLTGVSLPRSHGSRDRSGSKHG